MKLSPEPAKRLDNFCDSIAKTRANENVITLGDFNININDADEPSISINSLFKGRLLDNFPYEGFTLVVRTGTLQ